jgi:hypothetical protein
VKVGRGGDQHHASKTAQIVQDRDGHLALAVGIRHGQHLAEHHRRRLRSKTASLVEANDTRHEPAMILIPQTPDDVVESGSQDCLSRVLRVHCATDRRLVDHSDIVNVGDQDAIGFHPCKAVRVACGDQRAMDGVQYL